MDVGTEGARRNSRGAQISDLKSRCPAPWGSQSSRRGRLGEKMTDAVNLRCQRDIHRNVARGRVGYMEIGF